MAALHTFIVEDSPVIRDSLIATLEELVPIEVVGMAEEEATAIAWLADPAHAVDLVIVDIFLKSGSGLGVVRAATAAGTARHVVVLSNYATREIRLKCLELGAHRVFDKSTEIDALMLYCEALANGNRQYRSGDAGLKANPETPHAIAIARHPQKAKPPGPSCWSSWRVVVMVYVSENANQMAMAKVRQLGSQGQVRMLLQTIAQSVLEAESAQRGYLLTGRDEYLRAYQEAKPRIDNGFAILHGLYTSDSQTLSRIEALRGLTETKLSELLLTLQLAQDGKRPKPAVDIVLSGLGNEYMVAVAQAQRRLGGGGDPQDRSHQPEHLRYPAVLLVGGRGIGCPQPADAAGGLAPERRAGRPTRAPQADAQGSSRSGWSAKWPSAPPSCANSTTTCKPPARTSDTVWRATCMTNWVPC